jgi:hypothetical protein
MTTTLRNYVWHRYYTSPFFRFREAWQFILHYGQRPFDSLPLSGVGVEIGVWRGDHAAAMLKRHPRISMLYCIDPYENYDSGQQANFLCEAERVARKKLARFPERHQFVRGTSDDLRGLPDFDFAYVDGNHAAPYPTIDIKNLWPMIRRGGILGGHDFHRSWPGVISAVIDFVQREELTLHVEHEDWWVFKR